MQTIKNQLKIGDRVFLHNTPLTVHSLQESFLWENPDYPEVMCVWIDNTGQKKLEVLKECTLRKAIDEQVSKQLEILPLLYSQDIDCYAWKVYSSLLASSFHKDNENFNENSEKETRFVYDFKKYGKHRAKIQDYLTILKAYFDTNTLVVVPSHTPQLNELQKLIGCTIERTTETTPRKYNHKVGLNKDYANSYVIDYQKIKEKKVLLIDDIVNSGTTLNHFAALLQGKGYEVIKFALGMDYKLPYTLKDRFFVM
ncbi:MAG: phosphoribosyltransferase [Thermoflexibacteraceae bacterium]|jgi:hypothetical protein